MLEGFEASLELESRSPPRFAPPRPLPLPLPRPDAVVRPDTVDAVSSLDNVVGGRYPDDDMLYFLVKLVVTL